MTLLFYPLITFVIISLTWLMLSRVLLSLWQAKRVNSVKGWSPLLIQGFRIDIATICYALILPGILLSVMPTSGVIAIIIWCLIKIMLITFLTIFVYMELATVPFILEYDLRPNRLFIEYLIYPKEVLSMLIKGYKLELLIGTIGLIVSIWFGASFFQLPINFQAPWYERAIAVILVIGLGILGARSSLKHRGINPSSVAFSTDPLVNNLVLNSSYSVFYAATHMKDEADGAKYYGSMKDDDVIANARKFTGKDFALFDQKYPTSSFLKASNTKKQKNLVILLQESLGARFVGGLGGIEGLTPNLDKLMQEGWNFTNAYATGTRSVNGIEAVIAGFTPTPSRSVVRLGKSQTNFFTLAQILKQQDYHTQFIYGGESHFDNMKSFFLGNGFIDIHDEPTFKKPIFKGSWGVSDEDMYLKAHEQFSKLHNEGKKFFSLAFTVSNHSPYEFPDGDFELHEKPRATAKNTVKYSDYALGKFFELAKKSAYWDDTIFLVVADHDSRVYGDNLVPVSHFHIPALIIGSDITPRKDERLTSQIDLPTTLLSLIGVSGYTPMLGNDMTQDIATNQLHAPMQYDKTFGLLDGDNIITILQPQKDAVAYQYDFKTKSLTLSETSIDKVNMAKGIVLWGGLAYSKQLYTSD